MSNPAYIVEIFRDIVAATSAKMLTTLQAVDPLITGIRYEYGHYTDIQERMIQYSKTAKNERYPAIFILEDFVTRRGKIGLTGVTAPMILIVALTKPDITREQRDTLTFNPILWPIYNEFLRQIKVSGMFNVYDETKISHDLIVRPHHGKTDDKKNLRYYFTDSLDGIEMSNLQLETYLQNCLVGTNL
jgi:hypothetical protein